MVSKLGISFIFLSYLLVAQPKLDTFYADVLPIIQKNCQSCHKKNGNAPFALETYTDVVKRGTMISYVVESKYMPPWKANPNFRHFVGERSMDSSQIGILTRWVKNGMPKGTPSLSSRNTTIIYPKPDLVLKMPEKYYIEGNNKEVFICYKIPFEIPNERPVKAILFKPGNRKLVHHASYQVLATSKNANRKKPPYYFIYNDTVNQVDDHRDFNFLQLSDSSAAPRLVFHTGWLPGTGIQEFPNGIGFNMPSSGVLLIRNLHYSASPISQSDQSEIHIWFADAPVERVLEFAAFKPKNVRSIIPKDSVVTYSLTLRIGSEMSLLSINPHMHKLGKWFKAWALTPEKDTIPLIEIQDWDFNWQDFYRFKTLVHIPKGSFIHAEAKYDNTKSNLRNPNFPPMDVYFEKGNMDDDREEMMRLVFMYLPYRKGDELIGTENEF